MKILILGFSKIKYMPYINFYLNHIDKEQNDIHILYWNRDMQNEDLTPYHGCEFHEFRYYQEDDVAKVFKIKNFIRYRKFVKQVLRGESFDFIIALHTLATALVSDVLRKHYCGRYLFDYRDVTYESFLPFKNLIAQIVRHSLGTFISSNKFRNFLPPDCADKIYVSHNLLEDSLNHRTERIVSGKASDKIRIAFWGFIRPEKLNREMIRKFAADDRFELHYYGREQQSVQNLKKYTARIGAKNVFFHGEYQPEERYLFVRNTDLIHNIYDEPNMMSAMSNKYYDSIIFYIPLLSMKGSFMAENAEKARIGFSVNPWETDFTDKLYKSYQHFDRKEFEKNCDAEIDRIIKEYKAGADYIQKITS